VYDNVQCTFYFLIIKGEKLVVLPKFELPSFLKACAQHRVAIAHLVPPIVIKLAKDPAVDQYDLSALKVIMSAAAPLGKDICDEVNARLGVKLCQAYGMTELSPFTHMDDMNKPVFGICIHISPTPSRSIME